MIYYHATWRSAAPKTSSPNKLGDIHNSAGFFAESVEVAQEIVKSLDPSAEDIELRGYDPACEYDLQ